MRDLTEIELNSQFAKCILEYFLDNKPEIIIETGLYHGMGSTRIITSLIRDIPIENAEFYSIECNSESIAIAENNLKKFDLYDYVDIRSGLSIPRDLLPSNEEISKTIAKAKENGMVKLDHEQDPGNGANYYEKETSKFENSDILGEMIRKFNGEIDFLLLDSGGHIGHIEFKYAISLLKKPCAIALDDTRHIKHYQCLEMIKNDKRFNILNDNEEKFGSALTLFNP